MMTTDLGATIRDAMRDRAAAITGADLAAPPTHPTVVLGAGHAPRRRARLVPALALSVVAVAVVALAVAAAARHPAHRPAATTAPSQPTHPASAIVGYRWTLQTVQADGRTVLVAASPAVTLELRADGTFSGTDSVNGIGGRYVVTEAGIRVTESGTTLIAYAGHDQDRLLIIRGVDALVFGAGRAADAERPVRVLGGGMKFTVSPPGFVLTYTRAGPALPKPS